MTDEEIIATLLLLSKKHIKIKEKEALLAAINRLRNVRDFKFVKLRDAFDGG